jgi:hypothetical protein
MLAAAMAIDEEEFSPLVSLKAIAFHGDPALQTLSSAVRRDLAAAVKEVDVTRLPTIEPWRRRPSLD